MKLLTLRKPRPVSFPVADEVSPSKARNMPAMLFAFALLAFRDPPRLAVSKEWVFDAIPSLPRRSSAGIQRMAK
jgi:hypothetical protein